MQYRAFVPDAVHAPDKIPSLSVIDPSLDIAILAVVTALLSMAIIIGMFLKLAGRISAGNPVNVNVAELDVPEMDAYGM